MHRGEAPTSFVGASLLAKNLKALRYRLRPSSERSPEQARSYRYKKAPVTDEVTGAFSWGPVKPYHVPAAA
ncbi:hypothetical protein EMIT0P74_200046 [Pseudomonas sp. IT-P74]